ncbi:MAG: carboxylate-amine ligase [Armatimonadetes bacterium]|nr:MAG: carboxylate-amine ligase [Armatimonadota bacterium]
MTPERPRFTIGIEEEYFVVDRETRDLVDDLPKPLRDTLAHPPIGLTSPEFIRSQVEIGTPVAANMTEVAEYLATMRRFVADTVNDHGMAIISASTHPFADWIQQKHTDKARYNVLEEALQGVVRRLLICGMHVHVGIADEDLRIELMNQVTYFLPHLLAISGSSPFWQGEDTGLKSYRTTVFRSMPRTGLPDEFEGWSDYQRHVEVLVGTGVIEDASKLWWDIRPSSRYPTLEMRSTDICTRVVDGLAVAACYQSLLATLYQLRMENRRWRQYSRMLIQENNWRAQRYGVDESLIDFGRGSLCSVADLAAELIEIVRDEATELGSIDHVEHIRSIVENGTSADRQRRVYEDAIAGGAESRDALNAVVDHLIAETVEGV